MERDRFLGRRRGAAEARSVLAAVVLVISLLSPSGALAGPVCDGLPATIVGSSKADVLLGTVGPDVVWAGAGNDRIKGFDDDDILCGGTGEDVLIGGHGDDVLIGGRGADTLRGGGGVDECTGSPSQGSCESWNRTSAEPQPAPSPSAAPDPSPSASPGPSNSPSPQPSPTPGGGSGSNPAPQPNPEPQPDPEPTEDPDPDPTESPDPDPEPTEDPDPEPTEDPDPEPTEDPDPEPTEDPDPEPTEDPDPEPTDDPDPDPEDPGTDPADLRLTLADSRDVVDRDEEEPHWTYTTTITNAGEAPADGVVLEFGLWNTQSIANVVCDPACSQIGQRKLNFGVLAAGTTATVQVPVSTEWWTWQDGDYRRQTSETGTARMVAFVSSPAEGASSAHDNSAVEMTTIVGRDLSVEAGRTSEAPNTVRTPFEQEFIVRNSGNKAIDEARLIVGLRHAVDDYWDALFAIHKIETASTNEETKATCYVDESVDSYYSAGSWSGSVRPRIVCDLEGLGVNDEVLLTIGVLPLEPGHLGFSAAVGYPESILPRSAECGPVTAVWCSTRVDGVVGFMTEGDGNDHASAGRQIYDMPLGTPSVLP